MKRCEYCNELIPDNEIKCPNCGADYSQAVQVKQSSPQTIDELLLWYKTNNLPPFEKTRFFIGINYQQPRAFGIYKEGEEFVVYKNKNDGTRAIRYRGGNESFAVNEIYLKLLEILHQNNYTINNNVKKNKNNAENKQNSLWGFIKGFFKFYMIFILLITCFSQIGSLINRYQESRKVNSGYYVSKNNEVLYNERYCYHVKGYHWWKYNFEINEWEGYSVEANDYSIPYPYSKKDLKDYYSVKNFEYEFSSIYHSKAYIDDGNHYEPYSGYYKIGEKSLYYLNDYYGYSYGKQDNSGWYVFNNENGLWEFFCLYNAKDYLDEELWYNADDYYCGSSYLNLSLDDYVLTSKFEWSDWFKDYSEAKDNYEKSKNNSSSKDTDKKNNNDNNTDFDTDIDTDFDFDIDFDTDW